MGSTKETRTIVSELRAAEGEERTVAGYAAVFNRETSIGDRFVELVAPGAFAESIAGGDVRALWSHNPDLVIGRTKNGSLQLREDDYGLAFKLKLPDTNQGNDAFKLIRDGYVTGVSFGFRVKEEKWARGNETTPHKRTLVKVELFEISPTAFPAYEDTHVAAREATEALKEVTAQWEKEQAAAKAAELSRGLEIKEKEFRLSRIR